MPLLCALFLMSQKNNIKHCCYSNLLMSQKQRCHIRKIIISTFLSEKKTITRLQLVLLHRLNIKGQVAFVRGLIVIRSNLLFLVLNGDLIVSCFLHTFYELLNVRLKVILYCLIHGSSFLRTARVWLPSQQKISNWTMNSFTWCYFVLMSFTRQRCISCKNFIFSRGSTIKRKIQF